MEKSFSNFYPVAGPELEAILERENCPQDVKKVLDKALWFTITEGGNLAKVLTIEEAFIVDEWMSPREKPKDFPPYLAKQLKDELGIEFEKPEESITMDQKFEIWKKLFTC